MIENRQEALTLNKIVFEDICHATLNEVIGLIISLDTINTSPSEHAWFLPPGKTFYSNKIVSLENGTTILPFCMLEGPVVLYPGSKIGPSAYLRPGTIIGPKCRIGHSVELNKSIISENSIISHRAYVGHSLLGRDSLIGAGFTASVRNKGDIPITIRSLTDGKVLMETGFLKAGIITESGVWIACHVVTMPGTYISKGTSCGPFNSLGGSRGAIVK